MRRGVGDPSITDYFHLAPLPHKCSPLSFLGLLFLGRARQDGRARLALGKACRARNLAWDVGSDPGGYEIEVLGTPHKGVMRQK